MAKVPEQLPLVPLEHTAFAFDPFDLMLQDFVAVVRGFELQTKVSLDRLRSVRVGFGLAAEPPEVALARFGALAGMSQLIAKVGGLGFRAHSPLGLAGSLRLGQRKFLRKRVDLRREQGQFFGEVSLLHASALSTFGPEALYRGAANAVPPIVWIRPGAEPS
jgi:hypothetical protein